MQSLQIGFVGLGVMGAPMATHLARAGHHLRLHDANAATARQLAQTRKRSVACSLPRSAASNLIASAK